MRICVWGFEYLKDGWVEGGGVEAVGEGVESWVGGYKDKFGYFCSFIRY